MTNGRVLAIGLDGFELTYAEHLMENGALPVVADRFQRSALLRLEHGAATRTGLAWEHFWSGRSPEAAHRPAAIEFDTQTYTAWAEGARFTPFFHERGVSTVVLDTPYADLSLTPETLGVVGWGCHDPGVSDTASNPPELARELDERAGRYPSAEWMYASPWPSVDATEAMRDGLVAGIEARGRAARWLFGERVRDWELAIVVAAELHSAAEAFWHGVDPAHPLHGHATAPVADAALRTVYDAIDRFVGELVEAIDADSVVLFAMGGMGSNYADVPTMVLLPELMSRWAGGRQLLQVPDAWAATPSVVPTASRELSGFERAWYPSVAASSETADGANGLRRAARLLPAPVYRRVSAARSAKRSRARATGYQSLEWQAGCWYRHQWPEMRAFALPSFYDGRIRVNVRGREANGLVDPDDYTATCDEIEELLRSCTSTWDGASVVEAIERPGGDDPWSVGSSGADLVVVWAPGVFGLEHPSLGRVGPVPYRRTGGHTGPYGFLSVTAPDVPSGDRGIESSFDVAPTILDLVGCAADTPSGTSLLPRLRGVTAG